MAAKRRRLSRSAEFERVYRQGRSKGNRFLVLYAFPRASAPRHRRRRKAAPRPVRVAQGRRRRRPHAREALPARGVLGGGRAAAGGLGLRRRRPPGRARAGRARRDARRAGRAGRARGPGGRQAVRQGCRPRPDPLLLALHLARPSAALQVPPQLLRLRRAGPSSATAYCAGSSSRCGASCAATRSATAGTTLRRPRPCSATAPTPTPECSLRRQSTSAADRPLRGGPQVLPRRRRAWAGASRSSC